MDQSATYQEAAGRAAGDAPNPVFPCSVSQERFWILDQLDPGNPALNVSVRWRLTGRADATTLEKAIQAVIARHEILRTSFFETDGRPMQRVQPDAAFRLGVIDLTRLTEADRATQVTRIGTADAGARFQLETAPLIRATLLQVAPAEAILLITAHHMVFDGWSIGVLVREVGGAYQAMREGRSPVLPELPLQYGDYTLWQRAWLESEALAADRAYWLTRLRDARYFEMPADRVRPPVQTHNGAMASLLLAREMTERIDTFGRQKGATFFMVVVAALTAMLHRYTGDSDIAIGTQTAGRDQIELEGLIGPFINTLVLRLDAASDLTLADLLDRARTAVREALEHRNMPFEQLIGLLNPPRDLSRGALFSVNIIFQRAFAQNQSHGDIAISGLPSHSPGALYDLNFVMVERPEGWRASCEYNTDLFDAETIDTILRCWQTVIAGFAANFATPLGRLPLLDDRETAALRAWNDTAAPYPAGTPFPLLFEAQARQSPDAVAVMFGASRMTYAELDAASNRAAHALRRHGVGRGKLVGICVERSIGMVVALLGIMKSGAAYVPLDPSYPAARLEQMIRDSGLTLLIADSPPPPGSPLAISPIITLSEVTGGSGSGGRPGDETSPGAIAAAEDIAYVIYTSGSTGRPKGVQIPHRALVNLLWSMRAKPGFTALDTLVAVTTLSFDIAGLEIFLPLLAGGRLVLASKDEAADGWLLTNLLRQSGATVLQGTPITWQILIEAGWDGRLTMLCGGEALSRKLADQLLAAGGTLWNMYGPTETTIWSAAGEVGEGSGPVTIGPPIANTQLYLLNEYLSPAPVGARGELYIGGDGVAAGYKNRPDLDRERFLPDPFRDQPGARLYRTGDVVRRRADGLIEFLGRADHQVKLRGFRIELGEVEAAVLRHPMVVAAAASVHRDQQGNDLLCLHAVPAPAWREPPEALVRELRLHMAGLLPPQMLPSAVVLMDALPRTANGKIDRQALPGPSREVRSHGPASDPAAEAPANELMRTLTGIWRDVLGVADIDPDANFFEMGGHSLLAARMLGAVEAEFGERVRLATLFRTPTIRGLADALRSPGEAMDDFAIQTLQSAGQGAPVIAINNFGVFHLLARELGTGQPFVSVYLADPDRSRPLRDRSLEQISAEYIRLIKQTWPNGPYTLVGWCVSGNIAYEAARQLRAAGDDVRLVVMIDTWAPGYRERLSAPRAFLAKMSYRFKWHLTEWRNGRRTLLQMFLRSQYGRYFRRLRFGGKSLRERVSEPDTRYDWFIDYLDACIARYQAKPYAGPVLLVRTSDEPSGLFLDSEMGWGDLLSGPFTVREIAGDHLGIFQTPSVTLLARGIQETLARLDTPHRPATLS